MIAIERGSRGEAGMTLPREPDRVRDQRIEQIVPLLTPAEILDELPLSAEHEDVVLRGRAEIGSILDQGDDRLLVVVGPCSVHDVDAALEYARRLAADRPRSCATTSASRCACTSRSRARRRAGRA